PQDEEGEAGSPAVARLSARTRPGYAPMFEALTGRLQTVFRTLRGHGHLTENELKEGLRALRLALLEADVHVDVVKTIIESVRTAATEQEIFKSLTPGQQIVKLVRDR